MSTIQLKNNISSEQYQMAVRVLEAMDVIEKTTLPPNNSNVPLSYYEEVLKRREDRKNGKVKCYSWENVKTELMKF